MTMREGEREKGEREKREGERKGREREEHRHNVWRQYALSLFTLHTHPPVSLLSADAAG